MFLKSKIYVSISFIIVFAAILSISSCDDTSLTSIKIPTSNVSYSQHIQPVLNIKCAITGCHDAVTSAGGYSMADWTSTTKIPFIIPNDPNNSLTVMTVTGQGGLPIMPPVNASILPMTEVEVNGLKTWIKEGAKNN